MKRYAMVLASVLWAVVTARAAEPAGKAPAAGAPDASAKKVVAIGSVEVDLLQRQVRFDAEVCLRQGVLEFFVVAWRTKTHESILHTKAKPEHLHAGLLMLGLAPGKPARWSGQDEGARFLPPAGAEVAIELLWKDKNARAKRCQVGEWLRGAENRKCRHVDKWVFVGSQVLPDGRYWASLDGELISLSNFASAIIDVPFQSSNANEAREFFANTKAIPDVGTKVRVVLSALPGAEKAPDARVLLEVDPFGRVRVDGKPMATPEAIQAWATKYIQRHERGMVVIRAAGKAMVHDVADARLNLRLGGVREFDVQRVPPDTAILPRTPEQARRMLEDWEGKFANARELIHDPGEQAQRVLDQMALHLRRMEARKNMLQEYEAHLRKALKGYRATSQPARAGE